MSGQAWWRGVWVAAGVAAAVVPSSAGAVEVEEPSCDCLLNLAASVAGAYASNVYQNASQADDLYAVGKLAFDLDLMPSPAWIVEVSYRGEMEVYNQLSEELHVGNALGLVAGYRALDTLYLSLHAGGDQVYYPDRPAYTLWGVLGGAALRWEAGEISTLKLRYRFRADQFPDYDLDNLSHAVRFSYEVLLGEYVELTLPLTWVARSYSERYLLTETGDPTSTLRSGHAFELAPLVTWEPFFDLRFDAGLTGKLNLTDDSYYYLGPFGSEDPAVDPELISHFDAYGSIAATLGTTWELHDSVTLAIELTGGARQYFERPAYDADGLDSGEVQLDGWLQPAAAIEWRAAEAFRIKASYGYLKQWSNDALWDYDDHRVLLEIGTAWES